MFKKIFQIALVAAILLLSSTAQAQVSNNSEGDLGTPCSPAGNMFASNEACTTTPTTYKVTIHEMGLCTTHPFQADRLGVTFDRTNCVTTYLDDAPAIIDIAALIGGTPQPLTGTSTPPTEGTYPHAYLVMGEAFTISASFTDSTPLVHVTRADGTTRAGLENMEELSENLRNFPDSTDGDPAVVCRSGFLAATVAGGTIDAYITNGALTRGLTAEVAAGDCTVNGRLVGVMNLNSPVVVTSETVQVLFNFNLTNQGAQFFGNANSSTTANSGSGPFSGSFTIINN